MTGSGWVAQLLGIGTGRDSKCAPRQKSEWEKRFRVGKGGDLNEEVTGPPPLEGSIHLLQHLVFTATPWAAQPQGLAAVLYPGRASRWQSGPAGEAAQAAQGFMRHRRRVQRCQREP